MTDFKHIEREAASERQEFAKSLDALSNALSPDNIKQHVAGYAETYGTDLMEQAWAAARRNPAGFALVGAGLGLLMAGTGARPEQPYSPTSQRTRTASDRAVPQPEDALFGFDERVAAADAAMAKEKGSDMSQAPTAKWLRDRIEDGLDTLSPKARMRVREARQAVVNAQEKVEDQARRAARKSASTMQSQPLAVGAVALGIGALIGALLPSSQREDELMGEHRDRLMAKAKSTLNEEMDKVHASAKSAISSNGASTSAGPSAAPQHH